MCEKGPQGVCEGWGELVLIIPLQVHFAQLVVSCQTINKKCPTLYLYKIVCLLDLFTNELTNMHKLYGDIAIAHHDLI